MPSHMSYCQIVVRFILLTATLAGFLYLTLHVIKPLKFRLEYYAYLGLVYGLVPLQMCWSVGPVANGLVEALIKLPDIVALAFKNMQKQMSKNLLELAKSIMGEGVGDVVLGPIVSLLSNCLTPTIMICAKLLNPGPFIPPALKDVSKMAPILVILLVLGFGYVWSFFANFLVLGVGIGTGFATLVLILLFVMTFKSDKIVHVFIYLVQAIVNGAMKQIILLLLPVEALEPILKQLGPNAPNLEEMRLNLANLCKLQLSLEEEPEDAGSDTEDTEHKDLLSSFRKRMACCSRNSSRDTTRTAGA